MHLISLKICENLCIVDSNDLKLLLAPFMGSSKASKFWGAWPWVGAAPPLDTLDLRCR